MAAYRGAKKIRIFWGVSAVSAPGAFAAGLGRDESLVGHDVVSSPGSVDGCVVGREETAVTSLDFAKVPLLLASLSIHDEESRIQAFARGLLVGVLSGAEDLAADEGAEKVGGGSLLVEGPLVSSPSNKFSRACVSESVWTHQPSSTCRPSPISACV